MQALSRFEKVRVRLVAKELVFVFPVVRQLFNNGALVLITETDRTNPK